MQLKHILDTTPVRIVAAATLLEGCCLAGDWPQTGRNPQHTGFTKDSPAPPYQIAWIVDFRPERIYTAQPVVADGRVVVTTQNGNVYALDAETGGRLWCFEAGETIWGGASLGTMEHGGAGLVFVASWDGAILALNAADGKEIWRYDAGEWISGSPCIADQTLFIGTRKGAMLALGMDGELKWRDRLSWHIFSTAAYNDGKVFVVTEDMLVHCLDASDGREVWTSRKMYGLLFREWYPVVHKGKVIVQVTPSIYLEAGTLDAFPFAEWDVPEELIDRMTERIEPPRNMSHGADRRWDPEGGIPPAEFFEGQKKIEEFYRLNPEYQTLYVLNETDGQQAYHAVHLYAYGGLESLALPPAVCCDGILIAPCPFRNSMFARFDLEKNRWLDIMFEVHLTNNDNSSFWSVGGKRMFLWGYHCRSKRIIDLETRTPYYPPYYNFSLGREESVVPAGYREMPVKRVSCLPDTRHPEYPVSGGTAFRRGRMFGTGASSPVIAGNKVFFMNGDREYAYGCTLTAYMEAEQ